MNSLEKSVFRSIHYNVSVKEIQKHFEQGTTPVFNGENKIRFKRKKSDANPKTKKQDSCTIADNCTCELSKLIHEVIHAMNKHPWTKSRFYPHLTCRKRGFCFTECSVSFDVRL